MQPGPQHHPAGRSAVYIVIQQLRATRFKELTLALCVILGIMIIGIRMHVAKEDSETCRVPVLRGSNGVLAEVIDAVVTVMNRDPNTAHRRVVVMPGIPSVMTLVHELTGSILELAIGIVALSLKASSTTLLVYKDMPCIRADLREMLVCGESFNTHITELGAMVAVLVCFVSIVVAAVYAVHAYFRWGGYPRLAAYVSYAMVVCVSVAVIISAVKALEYTHMQQCMRIPPRLGASFFDIPDTDRHCHFGAIGVPPGALVYNVPHAYAALVEAFARKCKVTGDSFAGVLYMLIGLVTTTTGRILACTLVTLGVSTFTLALLCEHLFQ